MQPYNIDFGTISDLAINERDPAKSLLFPGPARIDDRPELVRLANDLLEACKRMKDEADFSVVHAGIWWRGHWDRRTVDGIWLRLRKQPSVAPKLDTLDIRMPKAIEDILLHPDLSRGGLVLITGGTGCGKTTSASASVVSRLQRFGGFAYTVEDPPELPLNGWHGNGYCAQTRVENSELDKTAWTKAIRGALRSQAAATPSILFIGEIREEEAAGVALRAAGQGFLVIATLHASSIEAGVSVFAKMVGEASLMALSTLLRFVVYQKFVAETFQFQMLLIKEGSSASALIRASNFVALENEVSAQRNLLRSSVDLMRA